jgi:hypothetical protein
MSNQNVTLAPEVLKQLLADAATAAVKAALQALPQSTPSTSNLNAKADIRTQNEVRVAKAFAKLNYKNIVLLDREAKNIEQATVLTAQKWISRGFIPKKGEKAIRVKSAGRGQYRLFHRDQVEMLSPEDKKLAIAKQQEAIRKWNEQRSSTKNAKADRSEVYQG